MICAWLSLLKHLRLIVVRIPIANQPTKKTMSYRWGSLRHVILRRDDVINELGKRERDAALSACLFIIHQRQIPSKECFLFGSSPLKPGNPLSRLPAKD